MVPIGMFERVMPLDIMPTFLLRALAVDDLERAEKLGALGEDCGAPIVEGRLREIAKIASQHGGAAKSSGAGGGDVALGFFLNPESANAFAEACRKREFLPLDIALGADGVRREAR